jgi:hypothetical protein
MAQFTEHHEWIARSARLSRRATKVHRHLVEITEFEGLPNDNGTRFDPFYLLKGCPARMSKRVYYLERDTLEKRGLYKFVDGHAWGDVRVA